MQQIQEFSIHCHSKLGDGYDSIEDMIIEARKLGLKTIGISDHFWAVRHNLQQYTMAVRTAQDKQKFHVLMGLEVDNPTPERLEQLYHIKQNFNFDFLIGALHEVPYNGKKYYVGDKLNKDLLQNHLYQKTYWQTLPNLANDLFDIIAHFDLIKLTGIKTEPFFETEIDIALKEFKKHNQILEINTKHSSDTSENEPSDTIINKICDCKIPVIFSSDAHIKTQLINRFAEEQSRLAATLSKMRYIHKTSDLLRFLKQRHEKSE